MVGRSPVSWVVDNRLLAGALALALVVATAGVVALVSDEDAMPDRSRLTDRSGASEAEIDPSTGEAVDGDPEAAAAEEGAAAPGAARTGTGDGTSEGSAAAPILPGTKGAPPCTPKAVEGTGITKDEVVIGQIVTNVNELPQQLEPAHEGLQAYLRLVNDAGGVCGRKVRLEYRNDRLNPATHRSDYQELSREVFAFVANESLLESQDYDQSPPFDPRFTDGGEQVPDVGGLAFSYGRSQSDWHAGVVGSISPTMVGGGQSKFFVDETRAAGTPCRKAAAVYVLEPTGASEDQARLGAVALEQPWGGGLGEGNTKLYEQSLADPVPVYESRVEQMVDDGMNCLFSYLDLGSNINLARAMANRGVWPPSECDRGDECFRTFYVTLSTHDPKFIADGGKGAQQASTFVPHTPLNEAGHPAMKAYLDALKGIPGARPSTFSIFGFASGQMLVEALQACGAAPTRTCVMTHLRRMRDFTSGGLLGKVTPFKRTKATFGSYGTWDWKHIFNCTVALRVRDGTFKRINPAGSGFFCDTIKVARGTPG